MQLEDGLSTVRLVGAVCYAAVAAEILPKTGGDAGFVRWNYLPALATQIFSAAGPPSSVTLLSMASDRVLS